MLKDLRLAGRMILQSKGWTVVVLLSLAIGIGANAALFNAINGLLLKEVPVRDPETLVRLRWVGRNDMVTSSSDYGFTGKDAQGRNFRSTFSYPMFQQFVAENRSLTDLAAFAPFGRVNVVVDGQAEIATSFISSGNYYRMLGVSATLGRTIEPDDDRPTAPPVALVSHKFWRSRLGSSPSVVGKTIRINNVPVTVIGVLSPDFTGVQQAVDDPPDVSVPLSLDAQLDITGSSSPRLGQPTYWWLQVMGRLKPGVQPAQVEGNFAGMFRSTARAGLDGYLASLSETARSTSQNRNRSQVPDLRVDSGSRGIYDVNTTDVRAVTILGVVVALVLLIVCANVANLLLSRATTRRKEISVRLSLGASRGRLIRQLLTESLLLASIGGALGVLVGYWGQQLLPGKPGHATPMDWRVLLFIVAITAITGILFGIAPALRATSLNVSDTLKENSRSVVGSRTLLGKGLLVIQVAISLMLLVGAGLFLRTVHNLRTVDVGFNPQNLLLVRVNPQLTRYDESRTAQLYEQLVSRLGTVPGVRSVALSQPALLAGSVNSTSIFVQGRTYSADQQDSINRVVVSPGFFDTMEMPLRAGRAFTSRDIKGAPKVVVINEAAARQYFPNQNPLGQRFGSSLENNADLEIVGILRDAKYNSVRDAPPPTMYVPYQQARLFGATLELRTAGDPSRTMSAVREAIRQVDSNLPLLDTTTQMEQVEQRFLQEKVFAQAYLLFGGLALLLASIGLFGLMSYSVRRRTNEIGIRMALGAQQRDVLRMVLGESMLLVILGVGSGVGVALAIGRYVASLLFGLPPTDVMSMALAIAVMLLVSAVAGYLPARHASRVDPMVAVRTE